MRAGSASTTDRAISPPFARDALPENVYGRLETRICRSRRRRRASRSRVITKRRGWRSSPSHISKRPGALGRIAHSASPKPLSKAKQRRHSLRWAHTGISDAGWLALPPHVATRAAPGFPAAPGRALIQVCQVVREPVCRPRAPTCRIPPVGCNDMPVGRKRVQSRNRKAAEASIHPCSMMRWRRASSPHRAVNRCSQRYASRKRPSKASCRDLANPCGQLPASRYRPPVLAGVLRAGDTTCCAWRVAEGVNPGTGSGKQDRCT